LLAIKKLFYKNTEFYCLHFISENLLTATVVQIGMDMIEIVMDLIEISMDLIEISMDMIEIGMMKTDTQEVMVIHRWGEMTMAMGENCKHFHSLG
jgi:hypothetical protein